MNLKGRRLFAVEDGLDNVGSEEGEAEYPSDVRWVQAVGAGKVGDRVESGGVEKALPMEGASQGSDQRLVYLRTRRRPSGLA